MDPTALASADQVLGSGRGRWWRYLCVVARALRKAALECFSHLDHALPAAIASFLQLAGALPTALLTEDCGLSDRLRFLKLVVDYSKPTNHLSLIQENFSTVLVHHSDVAKWVGDGADAYANFCELRRLLVPNVADSFDMLELLARQLRKYDELYVENKTVANITTLTEMLHTDRGYSLKGDHSSSHQEGDSVSKGGLTSQLSAFLTKLTQWNDHVDADGTALEGTADPLTWACASCARLAMRPYRKLSCSRRYAGWSCCALAPSAKTRRGVASVCSSIWCSSTQPHACYNSRPVEIDSQKSRGPSRSDGGRGSTRLTLATALATGGGGSDG